MTRVVTYLFIRGRTPKLACSVGTMSWGVGGVRVTRVVELVMPFPIDFSAEATPSTSPPRRGSCPTSYVLHHPIQCRHSEWTARADADPDAARANKARTACSGGHDECAHARDPFHRHRRWPHSLDRPGLPLRAATPRLTFRHLQACARHRILGRTSGGDDP
jgi:hypothetical protein